MKHRWAAAWLACLAGLAAPALPQDPAARPRQSLPAAGGEDVLAGARALLRSGDLAAAAALLRRLVASDPGNGGARLLLGRIALARGDLETARDELELAAAAALPQPYLAWHLLGQTRLALDEPESAVAAWSRALELAPQFAPALVGRARAALRLAAPERAAADLERARSLPDPPPEATLLLAELRLLAGDFASAASLLGELNERRQAAGEDAPAARLLLLAARGDRESRTELRRLLGARPDLARGLLALGVVHLRSGEPAAAARAWRAALEVDDGDPVAWLLLRRLGEGAAAAWPAPFPDLGPRLEAARRLQRDGRLDRARELLEAILDRRPHHTGALLLVVRDAELREDRWAELAGYRRLLDTLTDLPALTAGAARVARAMGASEPAGCLAERALAGLPEDATLHYLLAVIRSDAGSHAAAADACRRAIALGLEEAPVYLTLGLAELESMRTAAAIAAFSRAVALDPDTVRALPRLAVASLEAGELAGLETLLERRLAAGAEEPDTLSNLGAIALAGNHLERARRRFERLTELEPDDAGAWYSLGLTLLRLDERERGETALERFRRLKAAEDERWLLYNQAHARRLEARAAAGAGEPRRALALYGELAAAGTAEIADYLAAGRLCLELGEPARGYDWFERVLAGSPYQAEALAGLAAAAAALGRSEEARRAEQRLELLAWPCSER